MICIGHGVMVFSLVIWHFHFGTNDLVQRLINLSLWKLGTLRSNCCVSQIAAQRLLLYVLPSQNGSCCAKERWIFSRPIVEHSK